MLMQQLIQGLAIGSVYGLIAIGYVLIWNARGVLNLAQGDIAMVGAFMILIFRQWLGLPYYLAFPLAILASMFIGYLIDLSAFRPLSGANDTSKLIATIGVAIFLRNLFRYIFGSDPYLFPSIFGENPVYVGELILVPQNIWTTVIGFALVLLLSLFLNKTSLGKSMRATAQDKEAAALMGINVNNTLTLTFILAAALGAIAGMLLAPMYFVKSELGATYGTKGYAAAVLGGLTSMPGAMVGGIVLGILECLAGAYISSAWQSAIAFFVLFLTLIIKPSGLFGKINNKE